MKFYGDIDLQQNQLKQVVVPTETEYPASPVVGQLVFLNSILYVCVSIAGALPVWVPLTREITLYTHAQGTASSAWSVNHALNTASVMVQVYDNTGTMIAPSSVVINDNNNLTVNFGSATSGHAVVTSGHDDGLMKPTYAYTFYQALAVTSWVVMHSLGYNPIVRVFVGTAEVQPLSIVFDTVNQLTITFSSAEAGYARLI